MNMNARTVIGFVALVLAATTWFTTDAAVWLAMAALAAATVTAALRGYLLALAAVAIVVLKTCFIDPTLWTLTAGDLPPGRDRSVDALRIFLLMLTVAPVIAIAVNQAYSKLTDVLIAVFAMSLLAGFLGIIAWKVTQGPLIAVFVGALVMCAYDFSRELRELSLGDENPPDA